MVAPIAQTTSVMTPSMPTKFCMPANMPSEASSAANVIPPVFGRAAEPLPTV